MLPELDKAGEGFWPEMDMCRCIRLELDGGMIWIATGYGLMTGGGGQGKDLGR